MVLQRKTPPSPNAPRTLALTAHAKRSKPRSASDAAPPLATILRRHNNTHTLTEDLASQRPMCPQPRLPQIYIEPVQSDTSSTSGATSSRASGATSSRASGTTSSRASGTPSSRSSSQQSRPTSKPLSRTSLSQPPSFAQGSSSESQPDGQLTTPPRSRPPNWDSRRGSRLNLETATPRTGSVLGAAEMEYKLLILLKHMFPEVAGTKQVFGEDAWEYGLDHAPPHDGITIDFDRQGLTFVSRICATMTV
jgi:hypothetical protein